MNTFETSAPRSLTPHSWTLIQDHIDAYAAASGANDFIHIDAARAAETPLGGTIAQGMLILAVMAEYLGYRVHNGSVWRTHGELDVRFRLPCRPGDRLTLAGMRIDDPSLEPGNVAYEVWCANQNGERVIVGRATIPRAAF